MKKAKSFKVCYECQGRGEKGFFYGKDWFLQGKCKKCGGTGRIK